MNEIRIISNSARRPARRRTRLAWLACLHLPTVLSGAAALESGIYRTTGGATVEEQGDRVPGSSRITPCSATLMFDLEAVEPTLTAVLSNAVLEGGDPFVLTVRSEFGARLPDGSWLFRGDYLGDLEPSGTQYGFDWRFSTSAEGQLLWSGVIGWEGGHLWQVSIADLAIVPDSTLFQPEIARFDSKITLSWHSILASHRLEQSTSLLETDWTSVATAVEVAGDRLSVTLDLIGTRQFFRLSKS